MTFNPFLELTRTHNSNLYLEPSAERSATVSMFRFGTNVYIPVRTHKINLLYYGDATLYNERPEANNTLQNTVGADISLQFPSGIISQIKDTYYSAADPAPDALSEPVKRVQNDLYYSLGRKWSSPVTTRALYEQRYLDYLEESYELTLNRRESKIGVEAQYAISSKSSVFGMYQFGYIDYMIAAVNDSHSHLIGGGMRVKLTEKTALEARAGVKARFYRVNSSNDDTLPVIALSAITDFSLRNRLVLEMYRDTAESSFSNNPYYVVDYFGAEIRHTFFKDIVAGLKLQYVNENYHNDVLLNSELIKRNDIRYFAGISCEFPVMKWLSLKGSYLYSIRDSNIDHYDYTDRYVSMSVRAKY